jgi:hypothetical protein
VDVFSRGADQNIDVHWWRDVLTAAPVYDTLDFDRHRLAEIEAQIAGVPHETDEAAWAIGRAMEAAMLARPRHLPEGSSTSPICYVTGRRPRPTRPSGGR